MLMKIIFWTKNQMCSVLNVCHKYSVPAIVIKEIQRTLNILDEIYGEKRDVYEDDGGFILFSNKPLTNSDLNNILDKYNIKKDEAEFTDVYCKNENVSWKITLHIITNDFGITTISPIYKNMEE